jgi:hypothetical protein
MYTYRELFKEARQHGVEKREKFNSSWASVCSTVQAPFKAAAGFVAVRGTEAAGTVLGWVTMR